jgi:mRNA deadenylase 3'-5' endonuclease subunit Ccr4
MDQIRVLTYNTLARLLCDESNFAKPHYMPDDILFENRYIKMWTKFEPYISLNYIFCLQEVDTMTSSKFQLDFKKKGYDFYFHPYGQPFNGYMGIGIAVPSHFKITNVDKFRITDGKDWPKYKNEDGIYAASVVKWMTLSYIDYTKKNYYAYNNSRNRWNFMLTLELETVSGKSILISTLHMPCAFRNESTMITYLALAREHLQKLAGDKPHVLAGDFNITLKNKNLYQLMTSGECDETSIVNDFPIEDVWRPTDCLIKPMTSAVKQKWGAEPLFTNKCINAVFKMKEPFAETLDYILISDQLSVISAFKEPANQDLLPGPDEPSDHLLIWAELTM